VHNVPIRYIKFVDALLKSQTQKYILHFVRSRMFPVYFTKNMTTFLSITKMFCFHRFESNIEDDDITHVSHNVTNFEFLYEPFYVSLDSGILIQIQLTCFKKNVKVFRKRH
jgi:hypothetical protein